MQLDSARALKATLLTNIVTQVAKPAVVRTLGVRSQALGSEAEAMRSIALGIAPTKKKAQHKIAVRVQRPVLLQHPLIDRIRKQAKGEVEVRYVGKIAKLETPSSLQKRRRPLVIGCSIGHYKITAGTLGCFVRSRSSQEILVLSNNHVLANENNAKAGDLILQQGNIDGGSNPQHGVARLVRFVRMKTTTTNFVDAATALPMDDIAFNAKKMGRFGNLAGMGPTFLDEGVGMRKVGRTTGETKGRVTAFELDNVVVGYDIGNIRFDDQVEIEGAGKGPFSAGGDSGSLIVDDDNLGVALLFAGGDAGGTNGMGLTYGNPLQAVLDALKVDLVF
jgi:hypothetical protein